MAFFSAQMLQVGRPPGTPAGALASISPAQNPVPLRGVYPAGALSSTDFRSCRMKGVYVPNPSEMSGRSRASSEVRAERAAEDSPLAGSCMDGVDDKQVSRK